MVVRVPERAETRAIIDLTAQYVAADGEAFEQVLSFCSPVLFSPNEDNVCN